MASGAFCFREYAPAKRRLHRERWIKPGQDFLEDNIKDYNYYLFDLDGTLTDPKIGITKSVQYALKKKKIIINDLSELEKFIGPPLNLSFQKYYNFNSDEAKECVKFYREYYTEKGIYENIIYPKIFDLLFILKENNKIVIIATSKPTIYAKQIVKHFNIFDFFDEIIGSNLDLTMTDKTEIIKHIINHYDISDEKEKIVMIGDKEHDIIGAKNNGIDSIGVLYGYSIGNELLNIKPTYLLKDSNELYLQIKNSLISIAPTS